jgi:hypothetical protein
MTWNRSNTILDAGSSAEIDADVIFTAALVGLAIGYGKKNQNWRLAMEPEIELDPKLQGDQRNARTDKDKKAMKKHNDLCTLVNQVARKFLANDKFTMSWGFSPSFTAGGMIAGGGSASFMDQTLKPEYKEFARKYLTAAKSPTSRTDPWEMYIGRGAYCGLVLDDKGDAVTAMSTIRTTIKEINNQNRSQIGNLYPDPLDRQVGDRWCPPASNAAYLKKDPKTEQMVSKDSTTLPQISVNRTWIWGMIGDADLQANLQSEGMKFFMSGDNRPGTDIVGYTHGLPRCVYECVRAGKGHPYEMSIGTKTFKLASCMGCTFFMIANGFAPSASHVGKAESWAPLYHVQGNNPSTLLAPIDHDHDQINAFVLANNRWADSMTSWMKDGAEAIAHVAGDDWLNPDHVASLSALSTRLKAVKDGDEAHRRDCCNLLLDAFTWHKSDADRVVATLKLGHAPAIDCDGNHWWWDTDNQTTLDNYVNPYTDNQLAGFADLSALAA